MINLGIYKEEAYLILNARPEARIKKALLDFNPQGLKPEQIEVVTVDKFGEIIQHQRRVARYSGFRFYEVHLSPLIACGEGVGGGVLVPHNTKEVLYFTEDLGNGVTLEMAAIPGGTFMMASPENEAERYNSESPQYRVTVICN